MLCPALGLVLATGSGPGLECLICGVGDVVDQSGLASSKIATSLLYSSGKLLQPELQLLELSIILILGCPWQYYIEMF